jgi:hypothetical protein
MSASFSLQQAALSVAKTKDKVGACQMMIAFNNGGSDEQIK